MPTRLLARLLVAVLALAGAVTGVVATPPPAAAATCSSAEGVSVVADFRGVGGGVESTCVQRAGGNAAELFGAAGHTLTRVSSQPGAVCKVDGLPGDANCSRMPPRDAFWGLFWSDGSGGWHFSHEGVDSLDVPEGGSVGWAWQTGGSSHTYPGVAPPQHESPSPEPDESPEPTREPEHSPSEGQPDDGAQDGTASADPSPDPPTSPSTEASPGATADLRERARREARARAREERRSAEQRADRQREAARERAEEQRRERRERREARVAEGAPEVRSDGDVVADPAPAADEGARVPTWVTVLVLLALAGLAAVLAVLRRRAAHAG